MTRFYPIVCNWTRLPMSGCLVIWSPPLSKYKLFSLEKHVYSSEGFFLSEITKLSPVKVLVGFCLVFNCQRFHQSRWIFVKSKEPVHRSVSVSQNNMLMLDYFSDFVKATVVGCSLLRMSQKTIFTSLNWSSHYTSDSTRNAKGWKIAFIGIGYCATKARAASQLQNLDRSVCKLWSVSLTASVNSTSM